MEQPTYVRRLLNQKVLLIIGAVVSIACGLLAGFTVVDGQIQSRVVKTFTAASTVLLTTTDPDILQTEIPGVTETIPTDGSGQPQEIVVREPTPLNLSESAIILAYLASSDEVMDVVSASIGGFEDGDAVTAVRRTTQPAGDERFGGRLTLPIIDITGVSTSADRAELIAAEATIAFNDLVVARQDEWEVPENIRLTLDELNAPTADEGEGSNPAIPVIVVTAGVFLLFIALALLIEAVRDRRRRAADDEDDDDATEGARRTPAPDAGADDDTDEAPARRRDAVPVGTERSGARQTRRRGRAPGASDDGADDIAALIGGDASANDRA
ncbi:hypothetical protein [Microbacterium aurantiacum]|uniref:Capsular polysaccharide biosynthesis protein n=1 Tax=Microbacterium aurantiacum TaxID=162393 RepID=A0AAJ2LYF2_9MICO|nr:hypothetical protein [Microbacterium aurantiacum]MDS0244209.1 hypothetical protein [Microbacterium aurantiacum]